MSSRQPFDDTDNVVVPVSNENFEFWLRMATDNKINTDNSWNFALIDYFHDFSLLREGDGVNFQRASTALDGCMKIYSQRVDSAVKDTGALLSTLNIQSKKQTKIRAAEGVINNNNNNTGTNDRYGNEEEGNDGEDSEDQEDEVDDDVTEASRNGKTKIRKLREKSNLLDSFESIKIKDSNKPIKVDPVFKNALTVFDEGGAKGLLNNILRISNDGKIIFDVENDESNNKTHNSDDSDDEEADTERIRQLDPTPLSLTYHNSDKFFFQGLKKFVSFDLINDNLSTCPSLSKLESVSNGNVDPGSVLEELDKIDVSDIELNIMQTLSKENVDNDGDNIIDGYDNNYDNFGFDYDINSDDGNSFQKDDITSNVSKRTQFSIIGDQDYGEENESDLLPNLFDETTNFEPNLTPQADNIFMSKLTSFDLERLNMFNEIGTRSSVYWKISRLKKSVNYEHNLNLELLNNQSNEKNNSSRRYEKKKQYKKSFHIDFMSDDENEEERVFETTDYLSKILLGEKDRKAGRNLMVNDTSFTVKNLAFLSLKPTQLSNTIILSRRKLNHKHREEINNIPANEDYFAETYKTNTHDNSILSELDDPKSSFNNDYNNEFDEFDANGVEGFDVPISQVSLQSQSQSQSQPNNRVDMLSYARRSKKVDIKLLKQNIWSSIEEISTHKKKRSASHFEEEGNYDDKGDEDDASYNTGKTSDTLISDVDIGAEIDSMKFTKVVEIMSSKYTNNVKKDLSTSFCFICLLHLANEQGLTLETRDNYEDIIIHK